MQVFWVSKNILFLPTKGKEMDKRMSVLFVTVLVAMACSALAAPTPVVVTATPVPTVNLPTITALNDRTVDCEPYPSFDAQWLDGIPPGASAKATGKTGPEDEHGLWYYVDWKDQPCWVYSKFVTTSGNVADLPIQPYDDKNENFRFCTYDDWRGKFQDGVRVILPNHKQEAIRGHTGWKNGMRNFLGRKTWITEFAGIDESGCITVHVVADDGRFPWRIHDMTLFDP